MVKETPPLKQSLPQARRHKAVLCQNKPDTPRAGLILPTPGALRQITPITRRHLTIHGFRATPPAIHHMSQGAYLSPQPLSSHSRSNPQPQPGWRGFQRRDEMQRVSWFSPVVGHPGKGKRSLQSSWYLNITSVCCLSSHKEHLDCPGCTPPSCESLKNACLPLPLLPHFFVFLPPSFFFFFFCWMNNFEVYL